MQPLKKQSIFRKIAVSFLVILAAIWFILEEWIWDHIMALMNRISRLKIMDRFKRLVQKVNPYVLLLFFAVPVILLLPVKLLALYLLASGKVVRGLLVLFAGKIVGTAIAAQLFFLTKEKLLTIKIFARVFYYLTGLKERLYNRLHKTLIYQKIHSFADSVKKMMLAFRLKIKEKLSNKYGILFTLRVIRQKFKRKNG